MKKLPIYKSGEVVGHALLDDRDFLAVCEWNWHLTHQGYAYREFRIEGKRHKVFLHRFILALTSDDKIQVDHKNRNRLDCQRSNLRLVDDIENHGNVFRKVHGGRPVSSRFRGVTYVKRTGKWQARVRIKDVMHNLGTFANESVAATVARQFRLQHLPGALD
jgi:hypothetical protein